MFTPEYAVAAFHDVLAKATTALNSEIEYAENMMIRMEAALHARNPDEFDSAQWEFEAAMNDATIFWKSGYAAFSALVLLSALSSYDADNADTLRRQDKYRKTLITEQGSMREVRVAEFY